MRSLNTQGKTSSVNGTGKTESKKSSSVPKALETLSNRLDEIKEELENHRSDELSKQVECMKSNLDDLAKTVDRLDAGHRHIEIPFIVISLVFALAGILGFYKIYQVENLIGQVETIRTSANLSKDGINKVLLRQIQNQMRIMINKYNITRSSDQEKAEVVDFKEMVAILNNLGVNNDEFRGMKALSEILCMLVIDENMEQAQELSRKIINEFPRDNFVLSRAKTLLALIPIAQSRNTVSDAEREQLLREAIAHDNTNAGAANALGIILSNQARLKLLKDGNFEAAHALMREAFLNYEVASLLNPSSTGKLKFINNKVYSSLVEIEYILNTEGAASPNIKVVLQENDAADLEQFFQTALIGVGLYEKSTDFPNPPETLAQVLWLQAEYYRKTGIRSEDQLLDLENQGAKKFKEALDKKLYARVKTAKDAVEQFESDPLHGYIINQRPDIAEKIREDIKGLRYASTQPVYLH